MSECEATVKCINLWDPVLCSTGQEVTTFAQYKQKYSPVLHFWSIKTKKYKELLCSITDGGKINRFHLKPRL